jgi:hypothetical protein
MTTHTYRKVPDIVTRKIAGEMFLVPVRGKLADLQRMFVLNSVGECIWELLNGTRNRDDIVTLIADRFEVDRQRAVADVEEFLLDLNAHGLAEAT